MKKLVFILFIVFCNSIAFAQNAVQTINIKASIYCDHCKQCESCGHRLEKAVFSLKGIKRVDIDEATKTIKVIYNDKKTTIDEIRQAIAKVGFDADDVKGDPTAYEKLDECCKRPE